MRAKSLDLVQFHWWDYNNPYYIDALKHLSDLRDEGKIKHVGLTNFDTERMQIMEDAGIKLASNQVQYSIVDRRPEVKMAGYCKGANIGLLAYGTVCGGLMSERYLGMPEPSISELDTLSLRKYKRMVDEWGGWRLFQQLLSSAWCHCRKPRRRNCKRCNALHSGQAGGRRGDNRGKAGDYQPP
jgi:aryl-alcohol dehydrogenase-like predicted oxidoreductase